MKSTCHLNRVQKADRNLKTKRDICCACIDYDHLECEEGALNIRTYNKQLEEDDELKTKMIATILLAQKEIKQLENDLGKLEVKK